MQKKSSTMSLDEFKDMRESWRKSIAEAEIKRIQYLKGQNQLHRTYTQIKKNQYIVQTLIDKKLKYRLDTAKNVVLVGCGMHPYSLFDLHQQYPHIKSVGIEIVPERAQLAEILIKHSPAKDNIIVTNQNGLDYDYSWLDIDDLVFVSVDVEIEKKIQEKVIMTSKASSFLCAPYHTSWREAWLSNT